MYTPCYLCGGSGARLWPSCSFPKQFVPLIEAKSLLDLTFNRVKSFGSPVFITNEEHRFFARNLLNCDSQSKENVISIFLKPAGRNTAAAMASSALIPGISPFDLLLFFTSGSFCARYCFIYINC